MADEEVATFMAVTGAERPAAEQLLAAFEGNVERAINWYLENDGGGGPNMTDADAALAARLMQAEDPQPLIDHDDAMANALAPHPAGPVAGRWSPGRPRIGGTSTGALADQGDVALIDDEDGGGDDEDAMLRAMAARRSATLAAAYQAQRTMEESMANMTRAIFPGAPGLPSVFPGLPGSFPGLGGGGSEPGVPSGLAVRGVGVRAPAVAPIGSIRSRAIEVDSDMDMDDEEYGGARRPVVTFEEAQDEDPDLALARRLQEEEEQRLLDGVAGPGAVAGASVPGRAAASGIGTEEDMEHVGLGVDRHELEEARMFEAVMLGIPYEPRLPTRGAAASSATAVAAPEVAETRTLRWEQDQAFEESLAADRAKEAAAEHAAREAEAAADAVRRAEEEAARVARAEAAALAELLAHKAAGLPTEPAAGVPGSLTLVVRLPDGTRLSRRFLAGHPLQAVFDFVDTSPPAAAASIKPGSYRLVNSYPRKVLDGAMAQLSLSDVGVTSDTALFLEVTAANAA